MLIEENYKQQLSRMAILKNVSNNNFRVSDFLLFKEYQSRLWQWKLELGFDGLDFFNKRKSYHNLFVDLSPPWANQIIPAAEIIGDLIRLGIDNIYDGIRDFQGYFLYLYINWQVFKLTQELSSHINLKEPYEPLFLLISRGALISRSDNYFAIGQKTFVKSVDNYFKMPSIETSFLDYLDKSLNDIPNQVEVNELWERFITSVKKSS